MSTVIEPKRSFAELQEIFRYGWRPVMRERDDGTLWCEHVPLTLQDTLYPELGDFVMEGPMHDVTRMYLASIFRARLAQDPTAFVLSDCGVYWDEPGFDHHCPDISIITGLVNPQRILRENSYQEKLFHVRPRALVEIVSRHIRNNDVVTKFQDYHTLRIPLYVIVDRQISDVDWKIVPYQYTPTQYLKLPTDERGRFWIDFMGIWLGVENEKVVCYDGKTDVIIGDYTEITRQLEQETARAESEKQRAESEKQGREAAEAKLKELEAELARLRGQ